MKTGKIIEPSNLGSLLIKNIVVVQASGVAITIKLYIVGQYK